MAKYIFVTGGVVSSLGKGIASASIGLLLKSRGLTVAIQKLDPYLNVDPGTMNPIEHGEVFVLDDGGEVGFGRLRIEAVQEVIAAECDEQDIGVGAGYAPVVAFEPAAGGVAGDSSGKTRTKRCSVRGARPTVSIPDDRAMTMMK
mgnify:CR=1 FL=1